METPHIIFQDESLLGLFKPASWFVHPPENPKYRRGLKRKTCTQWLSDNNYLHIHPAHRIDSATEGLVLFGKNKECLTFLNQQFVQQKIKKTYLAVVRGWFTHEEGTIELPLELDSTGNLVPCRTDYTVIKKIELPVQISKKFATSRYSVLSVHPQTGRWHQIRRHMNRVAHPLIGDCEHGDSHHNRYFREALQIQGLCLWAKELSLSHPVNGELLTITSPKPQKWLQIEKLFQIRI